MSFEKIIAVEKALSFPFAKKQINYEPNHEQGYTKPA
jgi:hypothetical protein